MVGLCTSIVCRLALGLAPEHQRVNERLRLLTSDMPEGRYELIKLRVYSWPADILHVRFRLVREPDTLLNLLVRLSDKLIMALAASDDFTEEAYRIEEMVQRVFTHCLEFCLLP